LATCGRYRIEYGREPECIPEYKWHGMAEYGREWHCSTDFEPYFVQDVLAVFSGSSVRAWEGDYM